ncbi:MAG: hypothetical protein ACRDK7_06625 [Solirubrobacteraceae bacterium]
MTTTAPTTDRQDSPEPAGKPRPRFSEEQTDCAVLGMLIYDSSCQLWSLEEIVRMHGNRVNAIDAINRLVATGLVHRIGEFVFPTLAARRSEELER